MFLNRLLAPLFLVLNISQVVLSKIKFMWEKLRRKYMSGNIIGLS